MKIVQNRKQTGRDTEEDDYDDDENMPEEIGTPTPKIYDTSERDGRYAPIRTNPEEDALQLHTDGEMSGENLKTNIRRSARDTLECTGKPYLLKAQHSAFNISDSTTIPLTVQNWQITSFVPDSMDLVVDSSNKCLAVRTVGMQRCPGFHKNVRFAK